MRKGVLLKRFRIVECFSYLELARSSLLKKYQLCSPSVHIVISTFKQLQLEWIEVQFRFTGKSFSEALILGSTNPKYDRRLFIDLRVQYMKIPSSEHGENKGRTCKQHVLNMFSSCSPHVLSLEFSCIELVNLWTICCHIVG